MILVVVNKKKCVFFLFFEILAFFCFFSELSYKKEGKSRGESKERVLDVT